MPTDLLTVSEFAEKIHVSDSTVYRWITKGQIDALKIVGSVRIRRTELDRLLGESGTAA